MKKWFWRGGMAAIFACSLVALASGCSPKVVTAMRERWEQLEAKVDSLDEQGMTELLQEQQSELSEAIREAESKLASIAAHNPAQAAALRSDFRKLLSDQEEILASREIDLLEKRKLVKAHLKRRHRLEEELVARSRLRRFGELAHAEARVAESSIRVTQAGSRQLVAEFMELLAERDYEEVRRLMTPAAREEISDRKLRRLQLLMPRNPEITLKMTGSITEVDVTGADGRHASMRLIASSSGLAIDNVGLHNVE